MLYYVLLCYIMLYYVLLCYIMLYYVILYHIIFTILYHIILYYIVLSHHCLMLGYVGSWSIPWFWVIPPWWLELQQYPWLLFDISMFWATIPVTGGWCGCWLSACSLSKADLTKKNTVSLTLAAQFSPRCHWYYDRNSLNMFHCISGKIFTGHHGNFTMKYGGFL